MLKSVELINFESHKHTFVEFAPGINIISGSSDSGKSSLLRAVRWVICNSPSGLSVVSWWAMKKKKQVEDTRVILTLEDGTTVERIRGTINGYIVNGGLPLEAVGTTVPEEIKKLLPFTEINIQRQLDSPFLLADSAGDVARFFNRMVNLEDADFYQGAIEAKRRQNAQTIVKLQETITTLTKEIAELSWLDKAEPLAEKIGELEAHYETTDSDIRNIKFTIQGYCDLKKSLERCGIIERAEYLLGKIAKLQERRTPIAKEVSTITASIARYKSISAEQIDATLIERAEPLIRRITRLKEERDALRRAVASMTATRREYTALDASWETTVKEIRPLEREYSLVELCPYCGNKLNTEVPTF